MLLGNHIGLIVLILENTSFLMWKPLKDSSGKHNSAIWLRKMHKVTFLTMFSKLNTLKCLVQVMILNINVLVFTIK